MDRDTKIELLKIGAMVIILIALIIGIVWMNKDTSKVDSNATEETSEYSEEEQLTEDETINDESEESIVTENSEESTETTNNEESPSTEN